MAISDLSVLEITPEYDRRDAPHHRQHAVNHRHQPLMASNVQDCGNTGVDARRRNHVRARLQIFSQHDSFVFDEMPKFGHGKFHQFVVSTGHLAIASKRSWMLS